MANHKLKIVHGMTNHKHKNERDLSNYMKRSQRNVTDTLQENFEALKKTNVNLQEKVNSLEKLIFALDAQCEMVSTKLVKVTKKNEFLTAKLQGERSSKLEMSERFQEVNSTHQQKLDILRQELEVLKAVEHKSNFSEEDKYNPVAERKIPARHPTEAPSMEFLFLQELQELKALNNDLSSKLQAETMKNKSMTKQEECLSTKLQIERTLRLELMDQLARHELAHRQEVEGLKQTNSLTNAASQELEIVKAENSVFPTRLQTKTELSSNIQTLNSRPPTSLEMATKKIPPQSNHEWLSNELRKGRAEVELEKNNNDLLKMLKTQLEKERILRLDLIQGLQKAIDGHQQTLEDHNHELGTQKLALHKMSNRLKVEENVAKNLEAQNKQLSTNVTAEIKKNDFLRKENESLTKRLEMEHSWRLELTNQLEKNKASYEQNLKALNQSSAATEALHHEIEALKAANLELTAKLQTETELSTELRAQHDELSTSLEREIQKNRDSRTVHLQREQMLRLELNESLQTEKGSYQEKIVALNQEVKALKTAKHKLSKRLNNEGGVTYNLKAMNKRLSSMLTMETNMNESLSKQLQKEHSWRLELTSQLKKHKVAHQQELDAVKQAGALTEALCQELEALKAAKAQTSNSKQEKMKDVSSALQALKDRLSTGLERKNKHGETLTPESLEKKTNTCHNQQAKENATPRQETVALGQKLDALKTAKNKLSKSFNSDWGLGHSEHPETEEANQQKLEAIYKESERLISEVLVPIIELVDRLGLKEMVPWMNKSPVPFDWQRSQVIR